MRAKFFRIILGIVLLMNSARLVAHHSTAGYDVDKPITLKGTLVKMEWANPHGSIYMNVKGPDGKMITWSVQTAAPSALRNQGVQKTDFQVGIEIVITGFRAKNGTPKAIGRILKLPDGTELFIR